MNKKNKRIVVVVISIVLLLAFISMLSNIDFKAKINNDEDNGDTVVECKHENHGINGMCKECDVYVGHKYVTNTGNYASNGDGKHNTSYKCDCGDIDGVTLVCVYEGGVCKYCGYDKSLADKCEHQTHDINGRCVVCGTDVGHQISVDYISNVNNTHDASYACVENCGYGGTNVVKCTFVNGKCSDCGATACVHPNHDENAKCISCNALVEHKESNSYEIIEDDDMYHKQITTCDICGKTTIYNKAQHKYGDDLICDKCGYEAVVE